MSRIQDILSKAERDGTARRTRALANEYAPRPAADEAVRGLGVVDGSSTRTLDDDLGSADAPAARERARVLPVADPSLRLPRQSHTDAAGGSGPARLSRHVDRSEVAAHGPSSLAAPTDAPMLDTPPRAVTEIDPLLVAALAPNSLAAEQYRSLRTRLKRAEQGRTLRTIAITSPAKGDGKSLTAANLALTMAQEFQQRVLLIDADLRRPTVHRLFGIPEAPGLGDVLMSVADLDQALLPLPEYHLTVLPAGVPPTNPAELLGSATMRRVLDTLRTRFDRVLIDVPPVAPLADLHILAPLVDGLLMIVRAGITPKPAIERALSGLDASKVLGLVLNEAGGAGADEDAYEGYGYIGG